MKRFLSGKQPGFAGVGAIINVVLGLVVLGTLMYSLWPLTYDISTNVTALTGTDAGTTTIQALWPVAAIIGGLALIIAIIMFVLRKAGLVD